MEKLNQFILAGISTRTVNKNNQAQIEIEKLCARFFHENISSKIVSKQDDKIYIAYTDYEGDFTKPYDVTIGHTVSSVDQIPTYLSMKVIPALNYEVFNVSGEYPKSLLKIWKDIWKSELNRTYIADFEIYEEDFDPDNARFAVYVSVKA